MRAVAFLWLGVVASWNGLSAQVGHERGQSPYRDVRRGAVGVLTFGYLGGSRGSVGVGLSDGNTGGIRYEALYGAIGASLGLAYGRTSRYVVDRSEEHTSELQSQSNLVCRLLLEKKKNHTARANDGQHAPHAL